MSGVRRGVRMRRAIAVIAASIVVGGFLTPSPALAEAPSVAGAFVSMDPTRLLDTRDGIGVAQGTVAANGTVSLQVTGRAGLPSTGVAAVVMNVTAVGPTAPGYLTAYPSGSPRPAVSNLNFQPGDIVANLVTVRLSDTGAVDLANASQGTMHLLADISGYYLSGTPTDAGAFVSLEPARLLDTRIGFGGDTPGAFGTVELQVGGRGGVPSTGVSAVVMNVTAVWGTHGGFATVYPSGTSVPFASNLNFDPRMTVPNLVTVAVGKDGKVNIANTALGTTDFIADVAGYYLAGTPTQPGTFVSMDPVRLFDSRRADSPNLYSLWPEYTGRTGSGRTSVTGQSGIPASGVSSVVLNLTTSPVGSFTVHVTGFVTAFPTGAPRPFASNSNYSGTRAIPNLVVVRIGTGGQVSFVNQGTGFVNLIGDVAGYFLSDPVA